MRPLTGNHPRRTVVSGSEAAAKVQHKCAGPLGGAASAYERSGGAMRSKKLTVAALGCVLAGLSMAPGTAQAARPAVTFQRVITGLNEPRGLAFDGRGSLYVAQAGKPGAGAMGQTRTGAVTKFRWAHGDLKRSWSTRFSSVYLIEEGNTQVLGPAAVSATGRGCGWHHRRHSQSGCGVLALVSESTKGIKAATGLNIPQLGRLYRLNGRTGKRTQVSNVGDQSYDWTADHKALFPDDFPDSNPYAVLVTKRGHHRSRTFVADAGANTISRVRANGRLQVISYIPNETAGAKRDATPTCIADGPDGALYVGTRNLLSNLTIGPGQSNVWRVDPNSTDWRHNAKLWARGFTTIDGCTFDHRGNFWASELFYPNASGPPGDLAKLKFSRHPAAADITHIGGGKIALPGGIAEGPDGAMYVSSGVADTTPNSGAVVRVSRH